MSRRPVSKERLQAIVVARSWERPPEFYPSGRAPSASVARDSRYPDLLSEPSTGIRKKSPARRPNPKAFNKAVECGRQIVKGQWLPKAPADLVGLYAVLHEHVYAVLPLELVDDFQAACSSAGKLVRDEFAGDFVEAQVFIAWCWKRVSKRMKRVRAGDGDVDFRPGWRLQFKSRTWVTDYKASGRS